MPLYSATVISCGFYETMLDVNFEGERQSDGHEFSQIANKLQSGLLCKNRINKNKLCCRKSREKKVKMGVIKRQMIKIKIINSVNT